MDIEAVELQKPRGIKVFKSETDFKMAFDGRSKYQVQIPSGLGIVDVVLLRWDEDAKIAYDDTKPGYLIRADGAAVQGNSKYLDIEGNFTLDLSIPNPNRMLGQIVSAHTWLGKSPTFTSELKHQKDDDDNDRLGSYEWKSKEFRNAGELFVPGEYRQLKDLYISFSNTRGGEVN